MSVRFVSYNNKSRKGFYWVKSYMQGGKKKTSTIKAETMSYKEFELYVNVLNESNFNNKDKRVFGRSYAESIKAVKEKEKPTKIIKKKYQEDITDLDFLKETKKDYNLERERSMNSLMRDRNSILTETEYERKETRIIFGVGNKSTLSGLTEKQFRTKLEGYMGKPINRNSRLFLDDIVNKWGNEIKR